jgi:hypothetical protein
MRWPTHIFHPRIPVDIMGLQYLPAAGHSRLGMCTPHHSRSVVDAKFSQGLKAGLKAGKCRRKDSVKSTKHNCHPTQTATVSTVPGTGEGWGLNFVKGRRGKAPGLPRSPSYPPRSRRRYGRLKNLTIGQFGVFAHTVPHKQVSAGQSRVRHAKRRN